MNNYQEVELIDFLRDFVMRNTDMGAAPIELEVTPEEFMILGEFFVQGLAGWILGIEKARRHRGSLREVTASNRMEPDPKSPDEEDFNDEN
jgi:hypothetical protein